MSRPARQRAAAAEEVARCAPAHHRHGAPARAFGATRRRHTRTDGGPLIRRLVSGPRRNVTVGSPRVVMSAGRRQLARRTVPVVSTVCARSDELEARDSATASVSAPRSEDDSMCGSRPTGPPSPDAPSPFVEQYALQRARTSTAWPNGRETPHAATGCRDLETEAFSVDDRLFLTRPTPEAPTASRVPSRPRSAVSARFRTVKTPPSEARHRIAQVFDPAPSSYNLDTNRAASTPWLRACVVRRARCGFVQVLNIGRVGVLASPASDVGSPAPSAGHGAVSDGRVL